MNWELFLGVASIVVTIVISVLIFFLQRSRKYPGRLSSSLIDFYRVLGKKPEHYVDLPLNLGNYQIENNLLYIKFILFNENSFDIAANTPEKRVKVLLPKFVKWVDLHLAKQNTLIDVDISIEEKDKSDASIGFSLLRQGESLLLEGLIETESEISKDSLFEQIQFFHRIPNVGVVEKINFPPERIKKGLSVKFFLSTLYLAAFVVFLFRAFYNEPIPLRYFDQNTNSSISIALNKNNEIIAYPNKWSRRGSYIISKDYFNEYLLPDTKYSRRYMQYFYLGTALLMLLSVMLLYFDYFRDVRRRKRLSKYL